MKRGYVETPEGLVHYRTEGKGEPLLLLHQVGLSSDQFTQMLPILAKTHRIIAMDILGYGSSDIPPYEIQIEDYARNVLHFLDGLHIKKASVFGRYIGASIAVEMAAASPARVDKLILSGCVYPDTPEVQKERLAFYESKRLKIKEDGSHLMTLWQDHLARAHFKLEDVQRSVVEYLQSGLGTKTEDGHIALFSYNIEPKLCMIKSPTLLLYPASDIWLGRIEAIKFLIPKCKMKIIEGTRAFPTWEKPQEFAQAILEFLKDKGI